MKLLYLYLTLFSFLSISAQKGAKIVFEQTTVNYGKVVKGEDNGLRTFVFKNTGDAPLIITNAQSTCGCTVPTIPKEPIAPGKSAKIEVRYDMRLGPIRRSITIETNATNVDNGRVYLRITGEVVEKDTSKS